MSKKGLVIVYTGDGKGKTAAALGLGLRAAGQGFNVLMIQFIKAEGMKGGEHQAIKKIPNFKIKSFGEGFVKIMGDCKAKNVHIKAAQEALAFSRKILADEQFEMLILDEIFPAVTWDLISKKDVLELIKIKKKKYPKLHLVLTGRGAFSQAIKLSDLVTEMREVKHPFKKGLKAQKGIEF